MLPIRVWTVELKAYAYAIMPDATEEKVEEYLRRTIIRYFEVKAANFLVEVLRQGGQEPSMKEIVTNLRAKTRRPLTIKS